VIREWLAIGRTSSTPEALVFKKALQIAVTLSLLLGSYAGYTRLFLIVTILLGEGRTDDSLAFPEVDAASARKATALAKETLGADHWAAQENLRLNYNEEDRGYVFYAQNHTFENERKRMILTPFAVVLLSADGKSHKTVTSDKATIDMSQPFGIQKPGDPPSHIVHATLTGNVRIRDDKGTVADLSDDLRIGPMTQLDYDEATLQITSDSEIFLEDRDLWLTGLSMMIQLRRKLSIIDPNAMPMGSGSGFDAEKLFVYKDVHIVSRDAVKEGIFPAQGKPEPLGKAPIDLRCDRTMEIDLPPPHPPLLIGPPDLNRKPEPTFAHFKTNVRVIRGTDKSDTLTCDTLDLTLMPRPRPPETRKVDELEESESKEPATGSVVVASTATPAPSGVETAAEAPAKSSSGPLGDLQLEKAIARGDAVWLVSEAQGLNARCVEMIHMKRPDGSTDYTYLNGGVSKNLSVEKTEFDLKSPVPGTIKSILVLKSLDATIFDLGPGTSKILARGPGRADERPARNATIQRTAYWEDEMELLTWREGDVAMPTPHLEALKALSDVTWHGPAPSQGTLRRVITLTGVSKLIDHGKPTPTEPGQTTTLDARKSIVAEFQASPGTDLQILNSVKDHRQIPGTGKDLIVLASVDQQLHFRVFDPEGRIVLDVAENTLKDRSKQVADLKTQLAKLADSSNPTFKDKSQILNASRTILGLTAPPEPPTEIKWLDAYLDAHLTAPNKTLTSREDLHSRFWPIPAPLAPASLSPSPTGFAGPVPAFAATSAPAPPSLVKPDPAPAAPDPAIDGRADRIWANLLMGSGGAKSELKNAMLRGRVMVHQDPAPGKIYPNEAIGEAIDLTGQGQGLMKFAVKADEPPHAFDPKTKLASTSNGRKSAPFTLARVDFDGKTIESENIIGLDQLKNFAWVDGAGIFTQLNDRGLFDDKGLDVDRSKGKSKNGGPSPQDKLVITWNDSMRFYGSSYDFDKRRVAKIEFRGTSKDVRMPNGKVEFRRGVDARMTESRMVGDWMDVYMDRTIDLGKKTGKPSPKPRPGEPVEPDPQIALLDCMGQNIIKKGWIIPGVDVINEKRYPGTVVLKEKQRIHGTHVIYDKRDGEFEAMGPGTTWLFQRDGKSTDQPTAESLKAAKPVLALKLTKVQYVEGMQGRFGVSRDQVDDKSREAIFLGQAQAANATVLSGDGDINFDDKKKAKDWVFLTSDEIHVFTEPYTLPNGESKTKQLLNARRNSTARTGDSTIQADRITFDSSTDLMYAYGEDDKEVALTKQESDGQTPSTTRGKMLRFNKTTHASDFTDPASITFTDLKSGFRPKAYFPDLGGSSAPYQPPKASRLPFMRTQRSATERKAFSNGQ
jgi:hypothetical protein